MSAAAAPAPPVVARTTPERLLRALGVIGLAIVVVAATVAALGAWPAGRDIAVDRPHLHGALVSPLAHRGWPLSRAGFLGALVVMCAGYALVVAAGRRVPLLWALAAIVFVNALFAAAPVVLSTDVFSYVDYARLGAVHG